MDLLLLLLFFFMPELTLNEIVEYGVKIKKVQELFRQQQQITFLDELARKRLLGRLSCMSLSTNRKFGNCGLNLLSNKIWFEKVLLE